MLLLLCIEGLSCLTPIITTKQEQDDVLTLTLISRIPIPAIEELKPCCLQVCHTPTIYPQFIYNKY